MLATVGIFPALCKKLSYEIQISGNISYTLSLCDPTHVGILYIYMSVYVLIKSLAL